MIIRLPHVEPIDTLNLPIDFEDRVKQSFFIFTECTNKDYVNEDKLLYIDNLRRYWLHEDISGEQAVKHLIMQTAEFELDEYGDLPAREDFWSLEFIGYCYEKGRNIKLKDEYENSSSRNNKTLNVISEIIKIVMNWEWSEKAI